MEQGILKGEGNLLFDWYGISCIEMTTDNIWFYLQNRLIQTSQTGGQRYSDTSPFRIPWMVSTNLANTSYNDLAYLGLVPVASSFRQ